MLHFNLGSSQQYISASGSQGSLPTPAWTRHQAYTMNALFIAHVWCLVLEFPERLHGYCSQTSKVTPGHPLVASSHLRCFVKGNSLHSHGCLISDRVFSLSLHRHTLWVAQNIHFILDCATCSFFRLLATTLKCWTVWNFKAWQCDPNWRKKCMQKVMSLTVNLAQYLHISSN